LIRDRELGERRGVDKTIDAHTGFKREAADLLRRVLVTSWRTEFSVTCVASPVGFRVPDVLGEAPGQADIRPMPISACDRPGYLLLGTET